MNASLKNEVLAETKERLLSALSDDFSQKLSQQVLSPVLSHGVRMATSKLISNVTKGSEARERLEALSEDHDMMLAAKYQSEKIEKPWAVDRLKAFLMGGTLLNLKKFSRTPNSKVSAKLAFSISI